MLTSNKALKSSFAVASAAFVLLFATSVQAGSCSSTKATASGCGTAKDIVDIAAGAGQFNTLVAAVKAAGLVDALKGDGPFTVFAPTDEAFGRLPKGTLESLLKPENRGTLQAILTYHVVPGRVTAAQVVKLTSAATLNGQRIDIAAGKKGVIVDNAKVVTTDILATNGVIHVIDNVILPATDDVVATAVKAGSFNTLAAALKAAGLIDTLQGKGPFTVFAPTDEAFAKLPEGTLETLLKPENKGQLTAILTYHVVPGRVYADQVPEAGAAKTVGGPALNLKRSETAVRVNDAAVVKADIETTNGVIHVIDSVLLPPQGQARAMEGAHHQIVQAIAHGSRMFNAGHHQACADLYEQTAMRLANSDELGHGMRQHLSRAVSESRRMDSAGDRAWRMRYALDAALASLTR
jgi:uncharacterized surface protein with fasciclin (FAS1) repeats